MEHEGPRREARPAAIWGFNLGNPCRRQDVDPILVFGRAPESCRVIAQALADAGYFVEWTTDPAATPGRIARRAYALLVVESAGAEIPDAPLDAAARIDPGLPILLVTDVSARPSRGGIVLPACGPLEKPLDFERFLFLVRSLARPPRRVS